MATAGWVNQRGPILPHVVALATNGREALEDDPHLANGLNISNGRIRHEAVARAFELPFHPT